MKKATFEQIISAIQTQSETISELYSKYRFDLHDTVFGRNEAELCKALKKEFNDKDDWIGYWMWELDFGAKWKPGTVIAKDGTDIPLRTVDDLWNILTK